MFGAQVKGIRGADAQVRSLKDVGEYDVWTTIVVQNAQAGELMGFAYSVGGQVAGAAGINATKIDTNMLVANQFVDESMSVYAVACQIKRLTEAAFQQVAGDGTFTATLADFEAIETHTLFRLHVGGDKPFAEGLLTWFPEAGGLAGMSQVNNAELISNNVATPASARKWEYKLPIGRIEKFWAELSWPRVGPAISLHPGSAGARNGRVGIIVRLLGVRARGVQ